MKSNKIDPEDFLDGADSIPANNIVYTNLSGEWVCSFEYLEWARAGIKQNDLHGFSDALVYAKRAVARRVDSLMLHNHLGDKFLWKKFPEKIELLEEIGISIPGVVQAISVTRRNQQEHSYAYPQKEQAKHAVGVAELLLSATSEEYGHGSIVGLNSIINYSHFTTPEFDTVSFGGWRSGSMLFIDILDDPVCTKLIDGDNQEIRYCPLPDFDTDQRVHLSRLLRKHFTCTSRSLTPFDKGTWASLKSQAGF